MEDDDRYLVIDGRRWRRSEPAIPSALHAELIVELMAARRLVRTDPETARPRVQDAKVALGERGQPWWEPAGDDARRLRIEATIRALLRNRPGGTICPSDVARVVGGDGWRSAMPAVRAAAADLADGGEVDVTQKGDVVDARSARGPVRIRLAG